MTGKEEEGKGWRERVETGREGKGQGEAADSEGAKIQRGSSEGPCC